MGSQRSTALTIGAALLTGGMFSGAADAQDTPRTADGHPDLRGFWGGQPGQGGGFGNLDSIGDGTTVRNFAGRGGDFIGFEEDGGLARLSNQYLNQPLYKPEYWETIKLNDLDGNWLDPQQFCRPPGLPRLGRPNQILYSDGTPHMILLYAGGFKANLYRVIPTDGREHNLPNVQLESWNGDSVGHWEGDTFVIESIGFTDESWLHKNGYIHGFDMRVVEKLTRVGDRLTWEVTVYDPEYLTEPWTLPPQNANLNTEPGMLLPETIPCEERDRQLITSRTRSG
jgi:hypothetical protein